MRKPFVFVLMCILICCIFANTGTVVYAEDEEITYDVWDGTVATSFESGDGSQENPFIIATASQLAYFATVAGQWGSSNKYYVELSNDIYLNDIQNYNHWEEDANGLNTWTSINDFKAHFNGNQHVIYGLYGENGLFLLCDGGDIENVNLKNTYIIGTKNATGGIVGCGKANSLGSIQNCSVDGVIRGSGELGGIAGEIDSFGNTTQFTVENCINYAEVYGSKNVGGIIGLANQDFHATVVSGCINKGNIICSNTEDGNAGGIIGKQIGDDKGTIQIEYCYNTGKVQGGQYVGGILGYAYPHFGALCTIDQCYNEANVNTTSASGYAGGIIGISYANVDAHTYIKNCYNHGNIVSENYAGGIAGAYAHVGSYDAGTKRIDNSYNSGLVKGTYKSACIPFYTSSVFSNCYYLDVSCDNDKEKVGEALSEDAMRNQDNFHNFDFDSIWKMDTDYPILKWQQTDVERGADSKIVQMVSEYTSDAIYAQYEAIMNSDVSEQMKQQKYYELFSQYGFLDVLEGIHYLSNTTQKRYAYLNLMTDASFCATSYQYWLDHTTKGHMARTLLVADGLVFNNELNDWMSFKTYAESDYPGVAKYKEMLYDFMDATADKIMVENCVKSVKDVQKLAKNVNAAAKTYADDLIQKINHCETTDELQNLMASAEAKGVFVNLASSYDQDGNPEFSFKLDETTGFGKFAKAMKWSNKIMSLCTLGYDEIQDMISLNGRLEVYAQYRTFLTDIVNNTEYIPFQLRWAAQQILEEMEEGYSGIVKNIVIEILDQSDINSEVLKAIVGKTGAASLSAWLTTIQIESYFINKLADVGEMVKKEAYVEGYAYLASAFKTQLEKTKQAFLKNKTEKNAWNFYYNYNILYQLRYKGEEAYLAFSKVNGLAGALYDFGYTDKKLVVDDTIKMLNERCQFVYDDEKELPESCQFAAKAVIKCPVNVMVYDEAGTEIAVLRDGVESDITNAYGRFAVVYNAYAGDYQKVLCFANADSDYRIRIQGTDAGFVTMEMASKQTDDTVYAFRNIEMQKDGAIETSIHQMTQDNSYSIDTDGDGIADTVKPVEVISHQYVPVTAVTFDKSSVDMLVGDSVMMKPGILPENASNQDLTWLSGNPGIVMVKDGKLYAVSTGQTSIYVIAQDNTDISATCVVTVSSKDTGLTGDDTKVPEKPALPGDDTSSGASQNPQGDSLSATQDADRIIEIHITGMSHRIAAGKKIKLTIKGMSKYEAAKRVKWSSSNTAYATVSAKGVVMTKKKGIGKTVTIRATATDGSGSTASYKIQILKHAVRKLQHKTTAKTIKCGKKLKLKLRILTTGKTANTKLKWTSSNTRYATVTQKGVVTAKKAGKGKTVRITAMATDGSGKKLKIKLKIQ